MEVQPNEGQTPAGYDSVEANGHVYSTLKPYGTDAFDIRRTRIPGIQQGATGNAASLALSNSATIVPTGGRWTCALDAVLKVGHTIRLYLRKMDAPETPLFGPDFPNDGQSEEQQAAAQLLTSNWVSRGPNEGVVAAQHLVPDRDALADRLQATGVMVTNAEGSNSGGDRVASFSELWEALFLGVPSVTCTTIVEKHGIGCGGAPHPHYEPIMRTNVFSPADEIIGHIAASNTPVDLLNEILSVVRIPVACPDCHPDGGSEDGSLRRMFIVDRLPYYVYVEFDTNERDGMENATVSGDVTYSSLSTGQVHRTRLEPVAVVFHSGIVSGGHVLVAVKISSERGWLVVDSNGAGRTWLVGPSTNLGSWAYEQHVAERVSGVVLRQS